MAAVFDVADHAKPFAVLEGHLDVGGLDGLAFGGEPLEIGHFLEVGFGVGVVVGMDEDSSLVVADASGALTRLMDMGVEPFLVASSLEGVLAQRLVRLNCPSCREPYTPEPSEVPPGLQLAAGAALTRSTGCRECRNTGFMGRTGIYEIFKISPLIRSHITESLDIADVRRAAVQEGMKPLRLSGAQKVAAGLTTVAEVLRVTPPPIGA